MSKPEMNYGHIPQALSKDHASLDGYRSNQFRELQLPEVTGKQYKQRNNGYRFTSSIDTALAARISATNAYAGD